jgi:hypothetical protein
MHLWRSHSGFRKRLITSLFAGAFALALPAAASADALDLSGGVMGSTAAGIVSLHGPGIGVVGLHPQLSFAVPFDSGGRYALTAEGLAPITVHGVFLGGGLGLGKLDEGASTGMLYDVLGGIDIAPHLAVVGRYYGGLSNSASQFFAGLSLRL